MRCVGIVEFMCEFHSECHTTQKSLGFITKDTSGVGKEIEQILKKNSKKSNLDLKKSEEYTEITKDKIESLEEIVTNKNNMLIKSDSDTESNKENIVPSKCGKRRAKSLQHLDQTKSTSSKECDETLHVHEYSKNDSCDSVVEKNIDSIDILTFNNEHLENRQDNLLTITCNNLKVKSIDNAIFLHLATDHDIPPNNVILKADDAITGVKPKNLIGSLCVIEQEKMEKKKSTCHRKSQFIKNKIINISKKQKGKMINKYCVSKSKYERKYFNSLANVSKGIEENVIFEGTIMKSADDSSIVIPLEPKLCNNKLELNNTVIADGSGIIQAQEIVCISNDFQLPDPQKSKEISCHAKNVSLASEDETEIIEQINDVTLIVQSSKQNVSKCTEKLIVVELQLPTTENSADISNTIENVERKYTVSSITSNHKSSELKFAKISELMTEEQKKNIEAHYRVDMSVVNEEKVNNLIIILDRNKYKCKMCEICYARFDKCQVHVWRHLDMKPYMCKICPFTTLTISNIRCHIRKSHLKIKPFVCHICNKCYNSSTLLEEHLNTHTNTRPYQCKLCQFASTSKQVLAHHILTHKATKDFVCDMCGKDFYSKGRMRTHQLSHNKDKAFKCSLCSVYVSNVNALERHINNSHTKKYKCDICKKEYKSKKALHNHESVHSEAKFQCPKCPNVYKSSHILREHILKHQGIRKYKCNSCDKTFAQQSHLAAHMAVHSNITYNCPGCKKGFNRHDNMKVHAKRCEKFLSKPELQSLLIKRKISTSKNQTAKKSDGETGKKKK